jgi:hypothetical protein
LAGSFVQVPADSTGKKLQTFNNTVGADSVHSEATTLVRSSDNTEIGTSSQPVRIDPTGTTTQPVSIASGSIGNTGFNVTPATSGGLSDYHVVSAASTNTANVKASAGQLYGFDIFNNANYPIYVKLHNTAGTPTAGSGVVQTIGVQAGSGKSWSSDIGRAFSTGIGISIVKDIADAGTTAVAASDCVVDLFYN